MKKILISFCLMLFAADLYAQEIDNATLIKEYKSKRTTNLIIGWTLLAGGTTMILVGATMDPGEKNSAWTFGLAGEYENSWDKAGWITLGGISAASSLIFFEFANRNKNKLIDLGLTIENFDKLKNGSIVKSSMPAFKFTYKL